MGSVDDTLLRTGRPTSGGCKGTYGGHSHRQGPTGASSRRSRCSCSPSSAPPRARPGSRFALGGALAQPSLASLLSRAAGVEQRATPPAPPRRRLSPLGWLALAGLGSILLAVLLGPLLWPRDPLEQDILARLLGASPAHPLGTDQFGRDLLARLLHGGRASPAPTSSVRPC